MKRLASLVAAAACLFVLASCAPAPQGSMASQGIAAPQAENANVPASAAKSASRGERAASDKFAETPTQQRRDLGTTWGENRASPVIQTNFTRHNLIRPDHVATLYYNDKAGVEAALAMEGTRSPRTSRTLQLADGVWLSVLDGSDDRMSLSMGRKTWLTGVVGERYSLRFKNESTRRYEVVVSVDGLDVINGRAAQYANAGYILEPGQELVIDGFRTSPSSVAAFRFGNAALSYAASKGSEAARNIGVIGVALFGEKVELREGANPFPGQNDPRYAQPPR